MKISMNLSRLFLAVLFGLALAPTAVQAQDEVVYYHVDAIGSVRAITDASGAEIARYDYLPFGELWETNPPTPEDVRQFAGKERDSNTDLDYFGARHYRGVSGRFTTVDPVMNIDAAIIDPQRWNRYSYVVNRPFSMVDPDGRDPVTATTLAIAGGIGAVVYGSWNAYANIQQGRPWYQNLVYEAGKGFVVGATLGAAAPIAGAVSAGNITTTAVAAGTAIQRSDKLGELIGWGTGQGNAEQTIRVARELTAGRVAELVKQGVSREWVQKQLDMYVKAREMGKGSVNDQLLPRIDLMKKLLELMEKK